MSCSDVLRLRQSSAVAMVVAFMAFAMLGGEMANAHTAGGDGERARGKSDATLIGKEIHRYDPVSDSYSVYPRDGGPAQRMHLDNPKRTLPGDPQGAYAGPGTSLPGSEDGPFCANSGHRIVPVWSHAPGSGSYDSARQLIRSIIRRMNWKIKQEGSNSSSGARVPEMVVDCSAPGQIRVHDVPTAGSGYVDIRNTVQATLGTPSGAGAVKYLVFREDCGFSSVGFGYTGQSSDPRYSLKSASDSTSVGNYNRVFSTTAIVYGPPSCQPVYRTWETHVSVHELFHAMGATQYTTGAPAPFATPGSHCTDGLDMLCYDDGTIAGYSESRCPANGFYDSSVGTPIDCGFDTYFDTVEEPGEWLAGKWNVGGVENPFLTTNAPPAPPWTGDSVGVFRPANDTWYLSNGLINPMVPNFVASYGFPTQQSIAGDWDGDGDDSIGAFDAPSGMWYLRNANTTGGADVLVNFGGSGQLAVAGDWDGDGDDTVGVFQPSTGMWYLRNSNTNGAPDIYVNFGTSGQLPAVGDWDGDGDDTVGVFQPSIGMWYLRNTNNNGAPDVYINFGTAGHVPLAGDWDGDGDDNIGVYYPGSAGWDLRDINSNGPSDYAFVYGNAGDQAVAGNWDGL